VILLVVNHFGKIKRNKVSLQNTCRTAASTNTKRGTSIHIIMLMRMRCFMRHLVFTGISILTRRHGNGENVTGEEVDERFHRTNIRKKWSVDSGQWSVFSKNAFFRMNLKKSKTVVSYHDTMY